MRYSPPNNNIKPLMISVFLTVVSITSLYIASSIMQYKWLMQLTFLCFATAAIQVLLKYVLTRFEYVCEDENLLVYKYLGKKSVLVANISLKYSASYFITIEEFEKTKSDYKFSGTYVYTRNFKAENVYCYVTDAISRGALLKLECDEDFANYINFYIDKAYERKINDEI